jgi:hypothetical protein
MSIGPVIEKNDVRGTALSDEFVTSLKNRLREFRCLYGSQNKKPLGIDEVIYSIVFDLSSMIK